MPAAAHRADPTAIHNLAFYKFAAVADPEALRARLLKLCQRCELLGTIIVAEEGINAMLAGTKAGCEAFIEAIERSEEWSDLADLSDLPIKVSYCEEPPFGKLIVKVKPEIVTMRAGQIDLALPTAAHLPAETFRDWLRSGEEMVVIDTRNDYEVKIGSFRGALDPQTQAFNQFPDYVRERRGELRDQKIVMFCTGGIRCEKATRWMHREGFDEVYQLDGGVLRYFERIPDAHLDWEGELFVFDERVTVDTALQPQPAPLCDRCGQPISTSAGEPVCSCDKTP